MQFETREQLFEQLVECDVIVYDITDNAAQIDEAAWAVSEIHADLEHIDKQKIFILVSSVMTWARSKPLDPVSYFDNFLFLYNCKTVLCMAVLHMIV